MVVVVVDEEYLLSYEGVLNKCNFERYSIVRLLYSSFGDVIPLFGDVLDVIGHVKVMR